jgi:hypothetical protein
MSVRTIQQPSRKLEKLRQEIGAVSEGNLLWRRTAWQLANPHPFCPLCEANHLGKRTAW